MEITQKIQAALMFFPSTWGADEQEVSITSSGYSRNANCAIFKPDATRRLVIESSFIEANDVPWLVDYLTQALNASE